MTEEDRMTAAHQRDQAGFTLTELMIVVGIMGVLASVAIPSFVNYQLSSKQAEAMVNLSALAKTQKSYFAEFNQYVSAAPEPGASTATLPSSVTRSQKPLAIAFAAVGWVPDGDVFFDYDTVVDGFAGCSCANCFTATAYGDLDNDGFISEFVYFHPDASGGWCGVGVSGHGPPTSPADGSVQWDTVVRHSSSNRF